MKAQRDNMTPEVHYGKIISQQMQQQGVTNLMISKKLAYSESNDVRKLVLRPRIYTDVFWAFGIAMNHNFFTDLAALHPVKQATAREKELEQENADLKKENELLKSLIRR